MILSNPCRYSQARLLAFGERLRERNAPERGTRERERERDAPERERRDTERGT